MISAVDRKVRFDHAGLLEGHIGADDAVEFGLQMSVGDEEKGEGLLRRRKRSSGETDSCGEAGRSEQSKKLSAAGRVHHSMISLATVESKRPQRLTVCCPTPIMV